jgi:hypothetical protein
MEPYTVSSKSWHYHLATFWISDFTDKRNITLCTYLWRMLCGSFILVLSLALTLSFVIALGESLFYEFRWLLQLLIQHEHTTFPQQGLIALGGTLGVLVLGAFRLLSYLNGLRKPARRVPKDPSFLRQAYDSWKNKYCVRVRID